MKVLQFDTTVPKLIAAKGLRMVFGYKVFYKGPARPNGPVYIPEPFIKPEDWARLNIILNGFCGSDLNLMLLHDSSTASPFTSFPCVPAREIVAEITDMGKDVDGFKYGDIVVINPILACEALNISPVCPGRQVGRSSKCENFIRGESASGM